MRSVAFLRSINIPGRRVSKEQLIGVFEDLEFTNVDTFLASGNVLFDHDETADPKLLREALTSSLGYDVPTTLRSANEIQEISLFQPFGDEDVSRLNGKPQVVLLFGSPTSTERQLALNLAGTADLLVFAQRELHWLPPGGVSDSKLNLKAIAD
ncbi:MAG: DUF1697 domain-containing protein, partial [Acidimicrobiia bacterium]